MGKFNGKPTPLCSCQKENENFSYSCLFELWKDTLDIVMCVGEKGWLFWWKKRIGKDALTGFVFCFWSWTIQFALFSGSYNQFYRAKYISNLDVTLQQVLKITKIYLRALGISYLCLVYEYTWTFLFQMKGKYI